MFWRRYRLARIRYYNDIDANDESQRDFIDGWHNRLHKLTEGMFFSGLIQRDESGKGLKTALTSTTTKATTAGITIGGVVMWLQSQGIDTDSIFQLAKDTLPAGGFVGLTVAWLPKHNYKQG